MSELIEVGTYIKFRIPFPSEDNIHAECPWGEVVGVKTHGRIFARVKNELCYFDLHGCQLDDIVELERVWLGPDSEPIWQSVGLQRHS